MTLIDQLNRLAQIAPEVCNNLRSNRWIIGDYRFSFRNNIIVACLISRHKYVSGRPALAWLRDALEQVIEARGWQWSLNFITTYKSIAEVKSADRYTRKSADSPTEALLAALIAALGEGE